MKKKFIFLSLNHIIYNYHYYQNYIIDIVITNFFIISIKLTGLSRPQIRFCTKNKIKTFDESTKDKK